MRRCYASTSHNKAIPENKEKKPQKIARSVSNAPQNPQIIQTARLPCQTGFTKSQNTRPFM